MLGEKLDYLILKSFAHRKNIATEEELDSSSHDISLQSQEKAIIKVRKHIDRFDGLFPISPNLSYLDMGCGSGELTIALYEVGCTNITGIDFVRRNIAKCKLLAHKKGLDDAVQFICQDLHNWTPTKKYDVLLSFDAFEHIDNPKAFLAKMASFIAPNGIVIIAFGPLFHSPFGDHMDSFFRFKIPWRGVLFSEKSILRLRRECFRPTNDQANRYKDIVGGLNLMRYSEFLTYVHETGWEFSFLSLNPVLKRFPPLFHLIDMITKIPIVKDYFVNNICAILRRCSP